MPVPRDIWAPQNESHDDRPHMGEPWYEFPEQSPLAPSRYEGLENIELEEGVVRNQPGEPPKVLAG